MSNALDIYLKAEYRLYIGPDIITADWLRTVQEEAWKWMTSEERKLAFTTLKSLYLKWDIL